MLQGKLTSIVANVEAISLSDQDRGYRSIYRKVKYSVWDKTFIERGILDLVRWQESFDPSWYLIARISSAIEPSLTQTHDTLPSALSNLLAMRKAQRDDTQPLDLESSAFESSSQITGYRQVLHLTSLGSSWKLKFFGTGGFSARREGRYHVLEDEGHSDLVLLRTKTEGLGSRVPRSAACSIQARGLDGIVKSMSSVFRGLAALKLL